ncbi:MAG: tetraacyldisaccharide 4'-kinase [Zoogloea sp.]|nr:tetraacyldisaccharide 4'-kinase [Zoogloea sp.]
MPRAAPRHWQQRGIAALALLPLSALFALLAGLRGLAYRSGLLRAERLPVPVIVVGNIAVGGSGKTPVVLWLVGMLREAGYRPGIISRGYGGSVEGAACVPADGDPLVYGDEPVLLAGLAGCPVCVGRDRPAAGRCLLAAHPEVNVIVSDDGLQHYRLHRDVELVVVDEAVLGNRLYLPAGPLREGLGRLRSADLVLAHGGLSPACRTRLAGVPVFDFHLAGKVFERLGDASQTRPPADFIGRRLHAVAGIGRPERFFSQLEAMGLSIVRHAFPDHHDFSPADIAFPQDEAVLMTAKDAVKCAPFAPSEAWVWPVRAVVPDGAARCVLEKLDGSPTA